MQEESHNSGSQKVKRRRKISGRTIISLVAVAAIVGLGTIVFLQRRTIEDLNTATPSTEQVQKESAELKAKVSKLMELPNEDAIVATVENADKLKSQTFFENVENGDKVLIFTESKKSVLYRPSTNLVINFGPIVLTNTENAETTDSQ
jgi:uncharacterized protein HemX